MKTNKKNGVIIGVGAVCLAYILGKTKGSIKTLVNTGGSSTSISYKSLVPFEELLHLYVPFYS